jgi:hypothetical protein
MTLPLLNGRARSSLICPVNNCYSTKVLCIEDVFYKFSAMSISYDYVKLFAVLITWPKLLLTDPNAGLILVLTLFLAIELFPNALNFLKSKAIA